MMTLMNATFNKISRIYVLKTKSVYFHLSVNRRVGSNKVNKVFTGVWINVLSYYNIKILFSYMHGV